ncbi:hypothetical protein F4703DRAFT_1933642 [Phycomyces blakesleeanus]
MKNMLDENIIRKCWKRRAASFFDIFTLKHFNEMIEDYIHDAQQNQTSYDPEYDQEIYNDAFLIFNVLSAHKITLANYERFFLPATNSTESYATTKTRRDFGIALAVASNGTAALLLHGKRTVHSQSHIPLFIDANSVCTITPTSTTGKLIKLSRIIIWDEASMIN